MTADGYDIVTSRDGDIIAVVDTIPDHAPPAVKEGMARRRQFYREGVCACGARQPNRAARRAALQAARRAGTVAVLEVRHENGCPGSDTRLTAAIREWQKQEGGADA